MFKRIVNALESIAESLKSMQKAQEDGVKKMEQETAKGPERVKEIFDLVKQITGGKPDGN